MKNFILCILISFSCCGTICSQQLSLDELLSFDNLSAANVDSVMQSKGFTRWDTAANNIAFRFYGYSRSTGTNMEARYLQVGIKPDSSFTEIQYQTSFKTEALQMQQQLLNEDFVSTTGALKKLSFQKNNTSVFYAEEMVPEFGIILYTFIISTEQESNSKKIYKEI